MYCPRCGQLKKYNQSKYCYSCGLPLSKVEQVLVHQESSPPHADVVDQQIRPLSRDAKIGNTIALLGIILFAFAAFTSSWLFVFSFLASVLCVLFGFLLSFAAEEYPQEEGIVEKLLCFIGQRQPRVNGSDTKYLLMQNGIAGNLSTQRFNTGELSAPPSVTEGTTELLRGEVSGTTEYESIAEDSTGSNR